MTAYTTAEFQRRWQAIRAESDALIGPSLLDQIAIAERYEPGTAERIVDELGPERTLTLAYCRDAWLRPKQLQLVKSDAPLLVFIGGRGAGKTEVGGAWVNERLELGARELVLAGPTKGEIEQYMIGGRRRRCDGMLGSSVLDQLHPWLKVVSRLKEELPCLEIPDRQATIYVHSGMLKEFRGPNVDSVYHDEPIKWRYPEELISNLSLACRAVGRVRPQRLFTTSPKRLRFLRDLVMTPRAHVLHAFTWENVGNVDADWYSGEEERLRGTRQGREELEGELEADDGSELFSLSVIDRSRVTTAPTLDRIVVAIDPSGRDNRRSDEAGIVAAGISGGPQHGHGYMLEDATEKLSWDDWGRKALRVAEEHGASGIVVETNKFAGAVSANLRTAAAALGYEAATRPGTKHMVDLVHGSRRIQIIEVYSRGDKATRAGPVSTLYQRDRIHHVGHWHELEDEMSEFALGAPGHGGSPNRLDALVHAFTELFELDRSPEVDYAVTNRGYGGLVAELAGGARQPTAPAAVGLSGTLAQLMSAHRGRRI